MAVVVVSPPPPSNRAGLAGSGRATRRVAAEEVAGTRGAHADPVDVHRDVACVACGGWGGGGVAVVAAWRLPVLFFFLRLRSLFSPAHATPSLGILFTLFFGPRWSRRARSAARPEVRELLSRTSSTATPLLACPAPCSAHCHLCSALPPSRHPSSALPLPFLPAPPYLPSPSNEAAAGFIDQASLKPVALLIWLQ